MAARVVASRARVPSRRVRTSVGHHGALAVGVDHRDDDTRRRVGALEHRVDARRSQRVFEELSREVVAARADVRDVMSRPSERLGHVRR